MGPGLPTPLVSAAELAALLGRGDPAPALLDVRWSLVTGPARSDYRQGHIPGAGFVDLDRELAGPPGRGGRHPLPAPADFAASMRAAGVDHSRGVVVYDGGSSTSAARAWWLLRYFGHPSVAVLDGGLAAWVAGGGRLAEGVAWAREGDFSSRPGGMPVLGAAEAAAIAAGGGILLDGRAAERFRGEAEPVDAVAGHIPGARNRPTSLNAEASGRFLEPAVLRQAFAALGLDASGQLGSYCGSGVTAAHQVLALELAGYRAALYAGSWSEWIQDPERPVATGP